jgi:ribonuclease-3
MTEKLEKNLDYKFKNKQLLNVALRHKSVGRLSNERMEFLGDAVLNFIIAAELLHRYPKFREGDLSRLRSNLVNQDALAELARGFNLGDYIYLGAGERKSGGFRRSSILADAMEAIIGAIYLDSDINICYKKVLNWYKDRLTGLIQAGQKDAKTELQEVLQAQKLPLPVYDIVATKGKAHKQTFYVECSVVGLEIITKGKGISKQEAEQNAAKDFLTELKK